MVLGQIMAGRIDYFPARYLKPGPLSMAIKQQKYLAVARADFIHLLRQTGSFLDKFSDYVSDSSNTLTWETFRTALGLIATQYEHVNTSLSTYSMNKAPGKILDVPDTSGCVTQCLTYRVISPTKVLVFPELMTLLMLYLDPSQSNASHASPTAHVVPSLFLGQDGEVGETAVVLYDTVFVRGIA